MSDEPPVIDDTSLADLAWWTPARSAARWSTTSRAAGPTGCPSSRSPSSYLAEFLATTARDPDEVLIPMPHLNKALTVRLAAINAALAGCLPEYFPVVLAAWDAFMKDGMVSRSIWQSTTGTAPFSVLFGPLRTTLGFNSRGNVWGSGFRANATVGRAIRLGAINGLGLKPHVFDQATQGNPAKYSCFIAENEEDSPWPSLAVDNGFAPTDSAVTSTVIRSVLHIEARHTIVPEQLVSGLRRLAVPHRRAGAAERRRVHRAQLRARLAVRQARLVQDTTSARRSSPAAGGRTATSPRPARRRSPRAPAGGCPPTTRTPSRRKHPRTWTPPSSSSRPSTRCRSWWPARPTPASPRSSRPSASGTARWRSSRSRKSK